MERKFRFKGKTQTILESDLLKNGWPVDVMLEAGVLIEVQDEVSKFVVVVYDDRFSYVVAKERLQKNPYQIETENWHRFNNNLVTLMNDGEKSESTIPFEILKKAEEEFLGSNKKLKSEEIKKTSVEKKQTPADLKKFSLNDFRSFYKAAPTNNGSPVFKSLENDLVEMMLTELVLS